MGSERLQAAYRKGPAGLHFSPKEPMSSQPLRTQEEESFLSVSVSELVT